MKLGTLNALVAAIEEGSLRGAARRVGVSQPALTKMVRELEAELSTTLLVRSTTGVIPTAQGQVLYERARAAGRELHLAVEQIRQLDGRMVGDLHVIAVPLALMLLIPETLRTYSRAFPDVSLRISEELYTAQLVKLRKGEADLAVGPVPEGLPPGEFLAEPLMPIRMVAVTRPGHPLAGARSLRQLAEAKWVYTSAAGITGYAQLLFERHGLTAPPQGAVVNSTLGLLSLVTGGDFVALMPQPLAAHPAAAPFLSVLPIEEGELELEVGVIAKADTALKPAVRHFIAHLHRAAHQATKAG